MKTKQVCETCGGEYPSNGGFRIRIVGEHYDSYRVAPAPQTIEAAWALQRLFQSAPDLLAVVERLADEMAVYPAWERPCAVLDDARALLARVRGEAAP